MSDDPRDPFGPAIDFGDDAGDAADADAAFDAWIRRSALALNAPGPVPTEAMWSAIVAAHHTSLSANEGRIPGVLAIRRSRWLPPAVLAATLLLGVALDRFVIARSDRAATASVTGREPPFPAATSAGSGAPSGLYRLAAVQTLSQAEALLTVYRSDGSDAGSGTRSDARDLAAARQLAGWARDVLGSTRLLLDSPAGSDPQLRVLLDDIELVLVQIVRLSGTPLDSTDRALIDHALRDRDLLPRIRIAVPAGAVDAAIASDD